MSVNAGAPEGMGGYAWPGADEAALATACSRIARHLVRRGTRTVGVLPLPERPKRPGRGWARVSLAPLLERLADALAAFVGGDVAFVPS